MQACTTPSHKNPLKRRESSLDKAKGCEKAELTSLVSEHFKQNFNDTYKALKNNS